MPPPILAIVGPPSSGKTTLLKKLIPELNRRGFKIGTIKHHVHAFEMDKEGKDTWHHKKSGAHTVALSSPTGLGVITDVDHDHLPDELLGRYFHGVDLVIAEGYKSSDLPKIEVYRKDLAKKTFKNTNVSLRAIVSNDETDANIPHFHLDDISSLTEFVVKNFINNPAPSHTTLVVDGKPIFLNNFLKKFLCRAVMGMISSLKGCEKAEEITLTIRCKDAHGKK